MHIVYQTTNLVNGKIYVGVCNLEKRDSKKYQGSGINISRAIKKYGYQNFERETLFKCPNSNEAFWIERIIVNEWFVKQKWNYNIAVGGKGGNLGETVNKKISKNRSGISFNHSEATKIKIGLGSKGRKYSKETLEKRSKALKGRIFSEESKMKMSETRGQKLVMISKRDEPLLIFKSRMYAMKFVNLKTASPITKAASGSAKTSGKLLLNGKVTKFKWMYLKDWLKSREPPLTQNDS